MVATNDIDSLLMPPPPPRLPKKRQRLESAAALDPAAARKAAAAVITTGQSTPEGHDSVFSHHRLQNNPTAADAFANNSGGGNQKRSVSPDEIDTKISSSCIGNSGSSGGNCERSSHFLAASNANAFLVDGVEKRLEGAFDNLAAHDPMGVMDSGKNFHHEFQTSSHNYDPSAVSECEGKEGEEEESTVNNDFVTKSDKGYDIPPINASFRDIIGHGQAKLRLDEALLPLALPPELAESVLSGIRAAPASILLHGPPGCGKTKLARAVAGEAQAAFISVGPSDILSKFVGESESAIRGLFREGK